MKLRCFQTILTESREPVALTAACSDGEIAALCLTLKMREKWNVKLSILYNKYDFVHSSFLQVGRCLDLCPGWNHYIELHLINVLNFSKFDGKRQKKMPNEAKISWKLEFVCNHLLFHSTGNANYGTAGPPCALLTLTSPAWSLMFGL